MKNPNIYLKTIMITIKPKLNQILNRNIDNVVLCLPQSVIGTEFYKKDTRGDATNQKRPIVRFTDTQTPLTVHPRFNGTQPTAWEWKINWCGVFKMRWWRTFVLIKQIWSMVDERQYEKSFTMCQPSDEMTFISLNLFYTEIVLVRFVISYWSKFIYLFSYISYHFV